MAKQILRCLGDDVHTRETLLGGIFLAFLIPTRKLFLLVVLPLCMLAALYGPIAYIYGQPDYQSLISVLATNNGSENTPASAGFPLTVFHTAKAHPMSNV